MMKLELQATTSKTVHTGIQKNLVTRHREFFVPSVSKLLPCFQPHTKIMTANITLFTSTFERLNMAGEIPIQFV